MNFDYGKCEGCPINGQYEPMLPRGNPEGRFLVVTDRPRLNASALLPGPQMGIFASHMETQGYGRDDFAFTPMCHCAYDPDDFTNAEKRAIHTHCRQHFLDIADGQTFDAVISLGADATSHAIGKSTKITKVRGLPQIKDELEAPIFPMLSPGIVAAYPQNAPMFAADVAAFKRFVGGESSEGRHGRYEIVTDLQFLIDRDEEIVSFDTEDTGLRWYKTGVDVRTYNPALHRGKTVFSPRFQILTMQFTTAAGEGYMLVWDHPERPIPEADKPRLRNQLRKLLCKPERIVIGHNSKFDNVALWMTEDIRYRISGDTLMLAALVDENAIEKNLDAMTKIHVPEMAGYADEFNATVDKSRMWEVPLSRLVEYGCGDTDATFRLYQKLEAEVAEDELLWAHYCRVSIPGLNALAAMETEGMYCDQADALATFKLFMKDEVARQKQELLAAIPKQVKRDEIAAYQARSKANSRVPAEDILAFSRPDFLRSVLFTHPAGFRLTPKVYTDSTEKLKDHSKRVPSISTKDHLPYFFEDCPFTMQLAEHIKDSKLLGTSVEKFEQNYIVGGKVRPTYSLSKTLTGRTASEDPNGQNYPKRGARALTYRRMFTAPEGYFVCELDLSQAELRIAASLSGDKTMLDIYRDKGDIHTSTALIVIGKTMEQFRLLSKAEQKEARTKAKAVNFGFLYGMGWRKFIGFAKTQYGVTFTEAEAKRIRAGFFSKYRRLAPWHEAVRAFAAQHQYVRSYSGRIRHLPMLNSSEEYVQQEAFRQAINSPVQEFGSSLGVMALGRMNEEIDPEFLKVVGFIHDAIVVYVKQEYLDWGLRTVKHYMQSNPIEEWFGTKLKCPIVADCGFGHNLGEIVECEGFDLETEFDYGGLVDKEGNLLIEVPPQEVPPNNGFLTRSTYTLPEDEEDEVYIPPPARRHRTVRVATSESVVKRMTRSSKQTVINNRNRAAKVEQERVQRRSFRQVS